MCTPKLQFKANSAGVLAMRRSHRQARVETRNQTVFHVSVELFFSGLKWFSTCVDPSTGTYVRVNCGSGYVVPPNPRTQFNFNESCQYDYTQPYWGTSYSRLCITRILRPECDGASCEVEVVLRESNSQLRCSNQVRLRCVKG